MTDHKGEAMNGADAKSTELSLVLGTKSKSAAKICPVEAKVAGSSKLSWSPCNLCILSSSVLIKSRVRENRGCSG